MSNRLRSREIVLLWRATHSHETMYLSGSLGPMSMYETVRLPAAFGGHAGASESGWPKLATDSQPSQVLARKGEQRGSSLLVAKHGGKLIEDGVLAALVLIAILAVLVLTGPWLASLLGDALKLI
jgi:hypothetical protein